MASAAAEIITRKIQQGVDIVDLISEVVALKRRGQNFVGLCPFHSEKTPSFNVSPSKQIFKCFGCGAGGDVFTFVQLREKVGFLESRRLLAKRAGITLEEWDSRGDRDSAKGALYAANEWARMQFQRWLKDPQLGRAARDYISRRGLSDEVVERFGLGFSLASWDALQRAAAQAGTSVQILLGAGLVRPRNSGGGYRDTFYDRLMFPILDPAGQVIGFGGRTLGNDPAKYLNTPETAVFDKGRNLYGLSYARESIANRGRVIVVEGYTDCMMAHQFGFGETVATLGTALTVDHVRLLRRYTDNAYLVFDSDEAGSRAADRGLELFLTQQLDVRLVQVPEGKDPCDFLLAKGAEAFESVLKNALGALEFKWRTIYRRYGDADSGPRRREAVEEFLRLAATSAVFRSVDPIQRGLVLNQLSKLLSIPGTELHQHLIRLGRQIGERAALPGRSEGSTRPPEKVVPGGGDPEQRALREILEVLVNEPGYCNSLSEHFDVDRFKDPDLRRVAATVLRLAREYDDLTVSDLIAEMEEPGFARLITDLHQAGQARGNYAATIQMCVGRLQEIRNERLSRETAARLRSAGQEMSSEDQDPLLVSLATRVKQRRGPLPLNRMTAQDSPG